MIQFLENPSLKFHEFSGTEQFQIHIYTSSKPSFDSSNSISPFPKPNLSKHRESRPPSTPPLPSTEASASAFFNPPNNRPRNRDHGAESRRGGPRKLCITHATREELLINCLPRCVSSLGHHCLSLCDIAISGMAVREPTHGQPPPSPSPRLSSRCFPLVRVRECGTNRLEKEKFASIPRDSILY